MTILLTIGLALLAIILLSLLASGLLKGIDRKISARMQVVSDPPVLQPFYDIIKLFNKDTLCSQ
jgi:ech hydrogenase subunit B